MAIGGAPLRRLVAQAAADKKAREAAQAAADAKSLAEGRAAASRTQLMDRPRNQPGAGAPAGMQDEALEQRLGVRNRGLASRALLLDRRASRSLIG